MALRLVNTAPGDLVQTVKPGQTNYMGLKSETLTVDLTTLTLDIGLSSIMHGGVFPEDDAHLATLDLGIDFETSERRRPVTGASTKSLSSGSLILTRTSNNPSDQSLYEISTEITPGNSILGYFKFRKKSAWVSFNPDWCTLTNIKAPYFGIEHGSYNTGAYVFMRDNGGTGSFVFGGPLPAYNTVRGGQVELATDLDPSTGGTQGWMGLANNATIEVFIRFNTYVSPFRAELWIRAGTTAPIFQGSILVGALGTYPATTFTNGRSGVTNVARLFFGNLGQTGDILQLDDWALFPDYRTAIKQGEPTANHSRIVVPDLPIQFASDNEELPEALSVGRWFPVTGVDALAPAPEFAYQQGRRSPPLHVSVVKEDFGSMMLKRVEPKLEERIDGFMVEALLAGTSTLKSGDLVGPGFTVEDGSKAYTVAMLEAGVTKTYGIASDSVLYTDATNYYTPTDPVDFRTMKLVRLTVDRHRSKVLLHIDEDKVVEEAIGSTFPASSDSVGKVMFGHPFIHDYKAELKLNRFNYMNRYLAWETEDNVTPDDAGQPAAIKFSLNSSGAGASVVSPTELSITKTDFASSVTKRYYTKTQSFSDVGGIQVDFGMHVVAYTNNMGQSNAPNTAIDSGVTLYLGDKRLDFRCFDCGASGRRVGIVPGSGSEDDIVDETALGLQFSAVVDWTLPNIYRIVVKSFNSIEVWSGSVVEAPIITIPWRNDTFGFDLPTDVTASAIGFGHFNAFTLPSSSSVKWTHLRWGLSNGYELAVQQTYPNGYPKYLFGGKLFLQSDFSDF